MVALFLFMDITDSKLIPVEEIISAEKTLSKVITRTPVLLNHNLSEKYDCQLYLKREDMQVVRSFKIRGAYNKMSKMDPEQLTKGIMCASAGNHAQGVAMACRLLDVKGVIYMPSTTPEQKINKVRHHGGGKVEILLHGDTFDDAFEAAFKVAKEGGLPFIHPFDDRDIISGQGTVGKEILDDVEFKIDYLIVSVGGGGLISGIGSYFKQMSPHTQIIGVESSGAPAMYNSLRDKKVVHLQDIDPFADGIAVKSVGKTTFQIAQDVIDDIYLVPEGKICSTILELYTDEAIVMEPAGAIVISVLDDIKNKIKGKNVVAILSGGNNDIRRTEDIRERALIYEGKKHYFIVQFPQRAGALREFLELLGPKDDITHFEYTKKTSREQGPALVGIELENKEGFDSFVEKLNAHSFSFQHVNENPVLFNMLV